MIQPLRTVHRRAFVGLAFVLPAILWAGLGARPRPTPLATAHAVQLPPSAYLMRRSDRLWHRHAIQSEFYGDRNNSHMVYVVLKSEQDLSEPDLLLYWFDNESPASTLPAQARLLGALGLKRAFTLPQEAEHGGQLILYSLPNQAVVDTAIVEKLP